VARAVPPRRAAVSLAARVARAIPTRGSAIGVAPWVARAVPARGSAVGVAARRDGAHHLFPRPVSYSKLIAFDRPLAGAVLPGGAGRLVTESELARRDEEAFRRGVDAARAAADQQMVEFRADMERLSHDVLARLAAVEPALVAQLQEALPALAVELARRLLAGYEPPVDVVGRLCREALEQLFPEREGLELSLCPRDLELLQELNPGWLQRYPGLKLRADAALAPGDCQVRSRFGLTDARQETKLAVLAHGLTGA